MNSGGKSVITNFTIGFTLQIVPSMLKFKLIFEVYAISETLLKLWCYKHISHLYSRINHVKVS